LVQGSRSCGGSKIALSHWLGPWLIQQHVLLYKPWSVRHERHMQFLTSSTNFMGVSWSPDPAFPSSYTVRAKFCLCPKIKCGKIAHLGSGSPDVGDTWKGVYAYLKGGRYIAGMSTNVVFVKAGSECISFVLAVDQVVLSYRENTCDFWLGESCLSVFLWNRLELYRIFFTVMWIANV